MRASVEAQTNRPANSIKRGQYIHLESLKRVCERLRWANILHLKQNFPSIKRHEESPDNVNQIVWAHLGSQSFGENASEATWFGRCGLGVLVGDNALGFIMARMDTAAQEV